MKQCISIEKKTYQTGGTMAVLLDSAIRKVSGINAGDTVIITAECGKITIIKKEEV